MTDCIGVDIDIDDPLKFLFDVHVKEIGTSFNQSEYERIPVANTFASPEFRDNAYAFEMCGVRGVHPVAGPCGTFSNLSRRPTLSGRTLAPLFSASHPGTRPLIPLVINTDRVRFQATSDTRSSDSQHFMNLPGQSWEARARKSLWSRQGCGRPARSIAQMRSHFYFTGSTTKDS